MSLLARLGSRLSLEHFILLKIPWESPQLIPRAVERRWTLRWVPAVAMEYVLPPQMAKPSASASLESLAKPVIKRKRVL